MKKLSLALLVLMLAGCATPVAVKRTFPDVPASLMIKEETLTPLKAENPQLSDIIENANENAGKYYQLREKYRAWQEWYDTQKKIFNEVE
jgi:hypothetical protein